jgi:hypothetical protein
MSFTERKSFLISSRASWLPAALSCHPKNRRSITYVLGRALLAVRTNVTSFWVLLSSVLSVESHQDRSGCEPPYACYCYRHCCCKCCCCRRFWMKALTTTATGSLPTAAMAATTSDTTASTASASDPTVTAADC